MSDEIKADNAEDGDKVADDTGTKIDAGTKIDTGTKDTETKEPKETKPRSVSFNRDVHVKRFGKPRETRGLSSERPSTSLRKEPFTHLSEQELIEEANKVLAQAKSVSCTADHPPEKFFSLPHRRKKEDRLERRNSDDAGSPDVSRSGLGRSTSDVNSKKRKERTSLSTIFRRQQKGSKPPDAPIAVNTKPNVVVKRSKSDVSDLKSNTKINTTDFKPIRKRSGSETEEFLRSLRNKKAQLSPIIESSPREDYFKKTPPLDLLFKQKLTQKDSVKSDISSDSKKVNPVVKPPRYKSPEKVEPKPPARTKRGKSLEKDKERSPSITETPKRRTEVKKTLLVDEIDTIKAKDINPQEVKERIKESIKKIEENIYGSKEMKHSSQQPPDKPPLTRGHTVDPIVRYLREDQYSSPPKSHLISTTNGSNVNQPFSYTKPSVSPDPNLYLRNTSPERASSPVNKMTGKGVVYAHVVREQDDIGTTKQAKQTVHKTYTPPRQKYSNQSDEDEGLGYEDRYKYSRNRNTDYKDYKANEETYNSIEGYKVPDSPIKPIFRKYKLKSFEDLEPTYANEYPSHKDHEYIDTFRGRADGMDTKRNIIENENKDIDLDFNELSHRRQLLESRLNARKYEPVRPNPGETLTRYMMEKDPIYEAEKRRKATEKYVDETTRYFQRTLERDGFSENSVTEEYNKYDSDNHRVKYNTESRTFQTVPKGEVDRRAFLDSLGPDSRFKNDVQDFPPEPEYEPPSLELHGTGKSVLTQHELKEKKYKVKKHLTSSHDLLQSGPKYKGKDEYFGKRKGHYASNPEIVQERENDYKPESYHSSLRRVKNKDKYRQDTTVRRHDSGDSRDYYRDERSPRRYDVDNRLVDSGIENDFRRESSGELNRTRHRIQESDDEAYNTSMFLANERRHTEDNYPSEQIYANGEYLARFKDGHDEDYRPRERSDGSFYDPKVDRFDKSPSRIGDKVSAKPPKATKKLSGLEKVKQLFSRDSSKKSKKEKEVVQPTRTRVLKSPEHLARDDSEYRRYTDPEPSDIEVARKEYEPKEDRRYKSSKEDVRYRSSDPRDSDPERKYREEYDRRYDRSLKEERRYVERKEERRRYNSSDRESDHHRPSDAESERRKTKSKTARPLDSPALAERYRERRRLATPSPTPSPPLRPAATSAGNWFKSLDRLARKKTKTPSFKVEKESVLTTEDESPKKSYSKPSKPLESPAKNLRFFGDTDQDSDANIKSTVSKSKSHPQTKHSTLRKTTSNSSTGLDEVDHADMSKSYSLSSLHREEKSESPRTKQYYRRNLQNISEIHSNSEAESQLDRKIKVKPPISPYERSRSHSSSKTLKGSKTDLRRHGRSEERGSSSELRSSKQELRDMKHRRRTPATNSGESSTEGESSHHSQRSIVYLHATTVGDIPDPGRMARNRSRDDVSSVNSSNVHVRSTTKSFSLFAPWTPRHYSDQHDVHYAQRPRKPKETFRKASSTRNLAEDRTSTLQKNKSHSQTTLTRKPQNSRLTGSSSTLYRKPEKRSSKESLTQSATLRKQTRDKRSQSNEEILNGDSDRDRVSRSISMPKDNNKKAGWFKLSNKSKKPEINTRVR